MMNSYKAVKVAELRAKLGSIPAKLVLSVVIMFVLSWNTDLGKTAEVLASDPFDTLKDFVVFYGLLSYVYFFIRLFNNYVVGVLVAAAGVFAIYSVKDSLDPSQLKTLTFIMLIGGPVLDVIRLFRYSSLKREVIEESESLREKIDDIYESVQDYDDGYDRGYDDGYERGRSERLGSGRRKGIGRKKRSRNYDDRISDRRYRNGRDNYYDDGEDDRYDDYEDDYDEDYKNDYRDDYDEEYDEDYEEDYEESDGGYDGPGGGYGGRRNSFRSGDEDGRLYGFFDGCKSPESIKRRYRELCKVYHPDSGNGSEALFEVVSEEYRRLMDE